MIEDCKNPFPDTPFPEPPATVNNCRLCRESCGSDYPMIGATINPSNNWPTHSANYGVACMESYGRHSVGNNLKLCCQKESL